MKYRLKKGEEFISEDYRIIKKLVKKCGCGDCIDIMNKIEQVDERRDEIIKTILESIIKKDYESIIKDDNVRFECSFSIPASAKVVEKNIVDSKASLFAQKF